MAGRDKNQSILPNPKTYKKTFERSIFNLREKSTQLRKEVACLEESKKNLKDILKEELIRGRKEITVEIEKQIAPLRNIKEELIKRNREESAVLQRKLATIEKLKNDTVEVKKELADTELNIVDKKRTFDIECRDMARKFLDKEEELNSYSNSLDEREANIAAITAEAEAKVEKSMEAEKKADNIMGVARQMYKEAGERVELATLAIQEDKLAHKQYLQTSHFELDSKAAGLNSHETLLQSKERDLNKREEEVKLLEASIKKEQADLKKNWDAFINEKKKADWYNRKRVLP